MVSAGSLRLLQDCDLTLTTIDENSVKRVSLVDQTSPKTLPLSVDFLTPQILHRLKHGLSKNDFLPRALGFKSLNPDRAPFVLDATAGLGIDSFFIAALGARVRAVERSEIIFELLKDGERRLREAQHEPRLQAIATRLSFELGDALEVVRNLKADELPDVIYLDPMYPHESRSGTALPKKAMQIFRRLITGDDDAANVLEIAREMALDRVVVKRPLQAKSLGAEIPDHVFEGKTARFDMYLKRGRDRKRQKV